MIICIPKDSLGFDLSSYPGFKHAVNEACFNDEKCQQWSISFGDSDWFGYQYNQTHYLVKFHKGLRKI